MSEQNQKLPGLGLSVLVFVVSAFIIGFGILKLGVDAQIPIVVATTFVALMGVWVLKRPWSVVEKGLLDAIRTALQAVIILLIIGMVIGVWIQSGVVPTLIYYGLSILSPSIFLFATLVITSVVSLASGSSWTTAGTVGIALMGISEGLGIPAPLTAGIVISGSYFGDKMSPLSDTTNLAPAVAGSDLFDHIKAMCWSTGPTYIIVAIITLVLGMKYAGGTLDGAKIEAIQQMMRAEFTINFLGFVPPVLVILCAARKMPAVPGLFVGVIAGVAMSMVQGNSLGDIIGAVHYGYESTVASKFAGAEGGALTSLMSQYSFDIAPEMAREVGDMLNSLLTRGGMDSMLWTISLILCALGFGGVTESCGFLEVVVDMLTRKARSAGGLMAAAMGSCFASNLFFGDNYLAIAIPGRMFRKSFQEKGLAPMMLSRACEDAGTLTSVMIPWNSCGAFISNILGVSTLAYAPYCFLNYLNPIVSIILSFMGVGLYWRTKNGDVRAREYPGDPSELAEANLQTAAGD